MASRAQPGIGRPAPVRRLRDSLDQLPRVERADFPAQIEDVKTAVRWLRAHAAQYGYNPDEIAAMGDSAGGQLVALLGTSQGVPALEGTSLGDPRVSSGIKAAIVLYPENQPAIGTDVAVADPLLRRNVAGPQPA